MDGIDEETQMVPEDEEMNENEDYELLFGSNKLGVVDNYKATEKQVILFICKLECY